MKFSLNSAALLAIASLVAAQDISQLPACAQACSLQGLGSSGCPLTDTKCICAAKDYQAQVKTCVEGACTAAELIEVARVSVEICGDAVAGAASSGLASVTSEAGAAASSAGSRASSAVSEASAAASSVGAAASSVAASLSSSVASAVASATGTGAAVAMQVPAMGAMGMLFLGWLL